MYGRSFMKADAFDEDGPARAFIVIRRLGLGDGDKGNPTSLPERVGWTGDDSRGVRIGDDDGGDDDRMRADSLFWEPCKRLTRTCLSLQRSE